MNLSLDGVERKANYFTIEPALSISDISIFCANSSHLSVSRKLCIKSLGNSGVETFVVIWRLDYLVWASNSCVSFSRQQHRGQKAREILIKSEKLWGVSNFSHEFAISRKSYA